MNGSRAKQLRNAVGTDELGARRYVRKNGGLYATGLRRAIQNMKKDYYRRKRDGR